MIERFIPLSEIKHRYQSKNVVIRANAGIHVAALRWIPDNHPQSQVNLSSQIISGMTVEGYSPELPHENFRRNFTSPLVGEVVPKGRVRGILGSL